MSDVDHTAIYRAVRLRLCDLASDLDDDTLDRLTPATPQWRVRDVYAHLGGATADIVAGNLDGVASDAWTQAQVETRRSWQIAEVIDEWTRCAEVVEPLIGDIPPMMRSMLLIDAITHEHDIRGAIDRPGARDSDAIAFAAAGMVRGLSAQRSDAAGLRLVVDGAEHLLGTVEPTAAVSTTAFELVRAGVGRRALSQIAAWAWEGTPQPEALVLARFSPPRDEPLEE
jgi:uncharacterized protein (TIGR03083 family)